MDTLKTVDIQCPYCGETIELVIDLSVGNQNYIEDCEVCCRPITLDIQLIGEEEVIVEPSREDEL